MYTHRFSLVFKINTYANFAGKFLEASFDSTMFKFNEASETLQHCGQTRDLVLTGSAVFFYLIYFILRVFAEVLLLLSRHRSTISPRYGLKSPSYCSIAMGWVLSSRPTVLSKQTELREPNNVSSYHRVGREWAGCEESSRWADLFHTRRTKRFMLPTPLLPPSQVFAVTKLTSECFFDCFHQLDWTSIINHQLPTIVFVWLTVINSDSWSKMTLFLTCQLHRKEFLQSMSLLLETFGGFLRLIL